MKKKKNKWILDRCKKEASKYKSKVEWENSSGSSYIIALKNKWVEECCKHMKNRRDGSEAEREILGIIKKIFPDARKKRFYAKNRQFTFLELDILVPSLKKGIEFNGTYWHGKGFKRKWTDDPDVYHQVKKEFLLENGVSFITIKESDWVINKDNCILECINFLIKGALSENI